MSKGKAVLTSEHSNFYDPNTEDRARLRAAYRRSVTKTVAYGGIAMYHVAHIAADYLDRSGVIDYDHGLPVPIYIFGLVGAAIVALAGPSDRRKIASELEVLDAPVQITQGLEDLDTPLQLNE